MQQLFDSGVRGNLLNASGRPGLHVPQHGLKALHVWGVSMGQAVRKATVQTERLKLQPDETKAVLIKQHKEPWRALGTGKAMSSDKTRPIKAAMQNTTHQSTCDHVPQHFMSVRHYGKRSFILRWNLNLQFK